MKKRLTEPPVGFAIPALLIYTVLLVVPIIGALLLSFTKWNGVSQISFVGLKNYVRVFSDKRLGSAVVNTLIITGVVVVTINVVGLALAMLMNRATRGIAVLRSVFFMPYVLSCVAVSFVWKSMFSYTGVINGMMEILGKLPVDFLGHKGSAILCACIVDIWRTMGFYMVLYLAALQTVPQELYEACTIDGGNAWNKFVHVTLPNIVPGATVSVLLSIINELRAYDMIKILTDGGPGYDTETVVYNIVAQGFGNSSLGYSSAIAVLLFVVIGGITIFVMRMSNRLEAR